MYGLSHGEVPQAAPAFYYAAKTDSVPFAAFVIWKTFMGVHSRVTHPSGQRFVALVLDICAGETYGHWAIIEEFHQSHEAQLVMMKFHFRLFGWGWSSSRGHVVASRYR